MLPGWHTAECPQVAGPATENAQPPLNLNCGMETEAFGSNWLSDVSPLLVLNESLSVKLLGANLYMDLYMGSSDVDRHMLNKITNKQTNNEQKIPFHGLVYSCVNRCIRALPKSTIFQWVFNESSFTKAYDGEETHIIRMCGKIAYVAINI